LLIFGGKILTILAEILFYWGLKALRIPGLSWSR